VWLLLPIITKVSRARGQVVASLTSTSMKMRPLAADVGEKAVQRNKRSPVRYGLCLGHGHGHGHDAIAIGSSSSPGIRTTEAQIIGLAQSSKPERAAPPRESSSPSPRHSNSPQRFAETNAQADSKVVAYPPPGGSSSPVHAHAHVHVLEAARESLAVWSSAVENHSDREARDTIHETTQPRPLHDRRDVAGRVSTWKHALLVELDDAHKGRTDTDAHTRRTSVNLSILARGHAQVEAHRRRSVEDSVMLGGSAAPGDYYNREKLRHSHEAARGGWNHGAKVLRQEKTTNPLSDEAKAAAEVARRKASSRAQMHVGKRKSVADALSNVSRVVYAYGHHARVSVDETQADQVENNIQASEGATSYPDECSTSCLQWDEDDDDVKVDQPWWFAASLQPRNPSHNAKKDWRIRSKSCEPHHASKTLHLPHDTSHLPHHTLHLPHVGPGARPSSRVGGGRAPSRENKRDGNAYDDASFRTIAETDYGESDPLEKKMMNKSKAFIAAWYVVCGVWYVVVCGVRMCHEKMAR
jgi:hypothetical protein